MNERIRELRKSLNLTMKKFGQRIGISEGAVSNIEKGNRNVTEQMFKSVCREFNVNEEWLRDGTGSMFIKVDNFSLDEFLEKNGATELEIELAKAYFSLDKEFRRSIVEYFKQFLNKDQPLNKKLGIPDTIEDFEKFYPPNENQDKNSNIG